MRVKKKSKKSNVKYVDGQYKGFLISRERE